MAENLLSNCEREPIHIPGNIQPFGILLTVEPRLLQIQNVSENCALLWEMNPSGLLGRSLGDFLEPQDFKSLRHYLDTPKLEGQSPLLVRLPTEQSNSPSPWEVRAHEHMGMLFLEFEPTHVGSSTQPIEFHRRLGDSLMALSSAMSLQELCDATARHVKDITGFDRVMIYRFDADWHGVVIAEALEENVDSFLGLHFPASDIPSQARAIFLKNWLRMIPDVSYMPSRIYPGSRFDSGEPLDLGKAALRSVSPVHLQYLKNMGVQASLTISLIDDGNLWGLIACHHRTPRLIHSDARLGAQLIGQLASSQLRIKEALEDRDYLVRLEQQCVRLVSALDAEAGLIEGLLKHSNALLDIAGAEAGAIYYRNEWSLIGETPSQAEMESVMDWLPANMPDNGVFHTNSISEHFPQAARFRNSASGLLAIELSKAEKYYILWFRQEVATTVNWAGGPNKVVEKRDGQDILHPRVSFTSWQETVTGKAIPWKRVELDAVESLRNRILSIALQEELRKEKAARERAETLSNEKAEMVLMVSHDLRTPLSIVAMTFEFLQRRNPSQDPVMQRVIDRGAYGAEAMETLISEFLDLAKIEAGTLNPTLKAENAAKLISDAVDFLLPLANEKSVHLRSETTSTDCEVFCEKSRIIQVLNNFLTNALKFTLAGGEIIVSIRPEGDETVFNVTDTGSGIPPQDLPRLFDRFWQADKTRSLGTGLGLWISKEIIESHGGRIWATSEVGTGSSVCFTLKNALR